MSPKQKYTVTDKNVMPWTEQYDSVKRYLSRINSYRERAATDLFLYCEWAGKNPDEILALKSAYGVLDAEKLLDKFVFSKVSLPDTRKWHITMKVRGFYRANYKTLESNAGKMEYPPPKGQSLPNKEQRKRFFNEAYTPRDRALIAVMSCSAIALDTLAGLRWSNFEENWQQQETPHVSVGSELIKGHGKGKYRGVRQETFITPEAKQALISYRDWYAKQFKWRWTESDHVFLNTKGAKGEGMKRIQIARAMWHIHNRCGVEFSVHDGRRIVQTALESAGCPSNWIKKIKGRKCSGEESPYSKPNVEQLRGKYGDALPELEFLNSDGGAVTGKVDSLEAQNEALRGRLSKIEEMLRELAASNKVDAAVLDEKTPAG